MKSQRGWFAGNNGVKIQILILETKNGFNRER